jgi:hypothetical protein
MKRYWKKRKKRKPGFWVDVRLEAPNGSDNLLKLYVTPGAFKRYLEGRFGRGSGEARSVSDINFKNSCQCQWDSEKAHNEANSASKQGVSGENERN